MFNRPSTAQLITLTRSLGTSLQAGIDVIRAFELANAKTQGRLRPVLEEIIDQLKSGETVSGAFRSHGGFFPALFCDMLQVGESSGMLAEVLLALSDHYDNNRRLRNDFLGQITLPAVQLLAAILIIAGVFVITGWLSDLNGQTVDFLGLGLVGVQGAMIWLTGWAMLLAGLFIGYQVMAASLTGKVAVHRFLLSIPVVGSCMRSFAIARFSWAFHLTQEAGMPIEDSLEASLKATSNGAFIAASPDIIDHVMSGDTLTEALEKSTLFPVEFIELVHVAETAGTVPEALHRLSPRFEEQARRSMQALATAAGWTTRLLVGLFIAFAIFRIFFWYLNLINDAARGL